MAEAFELEQPHLMPMSTPFDGYVEWVARVSSTGLVTVHRNRTSVPCALANQKASIRLYADRVEVYAHDGLAARHERLFDREQVQYHWQHDLLSFLFRWWLFRRDRRGQGPNFGRRIRPP